MIYTCKNCEKPKRHEGCHATCEEYLKATAENEEAREKRHAENQSIYGHYGERSLKIKKRKNLPRK